MSSGEFESSEYDIGTTSVRLIRVGNVVQLVFSNKFDARLFYRITASNLKSQEEKLRRDRDES